jgi:transposase
MGDKAYSSKANRAYLRGRGIKAVIPVKEDQKANRLKLGSTGGRPPAFDAEGYKDRNTTERCFNRLKGFGRSRPVTDCEDGRVLPQVVV